MRGWQRHRSHGRGLRQLRLRNEAHALEERAGTPRGPSDRAPSHGNIPLMSLTREERQLALRVLRDSEQHVERLLTDLSEAQWLYRPAAEAWSISEIAEHVITMEGRTHETIERVLAEPAAAVE